VEGGYGGTLALFLDTQTCETAKASWWGRVAEVRKEQMGGKKNKEEEGGCPVLGEGQGLSLQ